MDLLQKCAQEFNRLVPYQYHVIIGRKGKTLKFTISFDRATDIKQSSYFLLYFGIKTISLQHQTIMDEKIINPST